LARDTADTHVLRPVTAPPALEGWSLVCGIGGWLLALLSLRVGLAPAVVVPWEVVLVGVVTWHYRQVWGAGTGLVLEVTRLWLIAHHQRWELLAAEGVLTMTVLGLTWLWVERRRDQWDQVQALARRDFLTQIANRQGLAEALEAEWGRLSRFGQPFTLAVLDCDGFKGINDTLGHARGDEVLIRLAATLRKNLRGYDTAARLGGDEFVILLPQTDLADAEHVLERLRTMLHFAVERDFPKLTITAGVAVFRTAPETPAECLDRADAAMYRAKHRGLSQTEFEVVQAPISRAVVPVSG
jgi:diguanylate cyclase (GGDEF)-like protein